MLWPGLEGVNTDGLDSIHGSTQLSRGQLGLQVCQNSTAKRLSVDKDAKNVSEYHRGDQRQRPGQR